jgi:hypothetical protein
MAIENSKWEWLHFQPGDVANEQVYFNSSLTGEIQLQLSGKGIRYSYR